MHHRAPLASSLLVGSRLLLFFLGQQSQKKVATPAELELSRRKDAKGGKSKATEVLVAQRQVQVSLRAVKKQIRKGGTSYNKRR